MNRRIISLLLSFVIVLSVLGVGCDSNSNITAQNSSEFLDELTISSEDEQPDNVNGSNSSESTSSDEWSEAPEDEELFFSDNGFGAFFSPSDENTTDASQNQNGSAEEDIFDIDTIPSFDGLLWEDTSSSSFSSQSAISSKPTQVSSTISSKEESTHLPSNSASSYSSETTESSEDMSSHSQTEPIYLNSTLELPPLTATYKNLLDRNPDRGYRTEMVLYIEETVDADDDPRTAYVNQSEKEIRKAVERVFNIYFKNGVTPLNKTFLAYIYITDFRDDDISKTAPVLEMFFKICRERKVKSMLRFCYNNSYAKNFTLSQENRDLLASECANQETMLKHIRQLKPYISKYKDTIHTISCGFVGFVGEWAYHYQYPEVDYPTVIKAIVENLCVPNDLYFSIRSPSYKEQLEDDYKFRNYISHNNDAMYGEQTNHGWHSGNFQVGHSNGWWEYVTRVAAYTPQGGEMYTNDALFKYNAIPSGLQIILECAHHRHTSMSNWHGYVEALSRDNIMSRWINNETITPQILDANNILYDPNWFVDDAGNSVSRNPYEFLKDHLGYKLTATTLGVKGKLSTGSSLELDMKLKNYGFAAAFMLESGFAILDSNYKPVSTVKAGDPEKWYSHAPDNSATTTALTHTVKANVKLPSGSGKYYVAFYLKNTMNDSARLSNKTTFKNGYNILFSINL